MARTEDDAPVLLPLAVPGPVLSLDEYFLSPFGWPLHWHSERWRAEDAGRVDGPVLADPHNPGEVLTWRLCDAVTGQPLTILSSDEARELAAFLRRRDRPSGPTAGTRAGGQRGA